LPGMIAVDKNKIHLCGNIIQRVKTEFFDERNMLPDLVSSQMRFGDHFMVTDTQTTLEKRIYSKSLAVFLHRLAQDNCIDAFKDTDLHYCRCPGYIPGQRLPFPGSCLRFGLANAEQNTEV